MQKLRGRFINLRDCKDRREEIEAQLDDLNMRTSYERFEAIKGKSNEAKQRGLSTGELGLWKSWLRILKEEAKLKQTDGTYLHIIEDDCILNKRLYEIIEDSTAINSKFDIIITDMYVNPSIYKVLRDRCTQNKAKSIVQLIRLYTGCTSSVLIHRSKIEHVYKVLDKEFEKKEKLIPIDNYLRKCDKGGEIIIGTTLPFLSSVRHDRIVKSTIQLTNMENKGIDLTQKFCSVLRKELSILPYDTGEIKRLIEIFSELIRIKEIKEPSRSDIEIIIGTILDYSKGRNILEYKYRGNLRNEEDNPQKELLSDGFN